MNIKNLLSSIPGMAKNFSVKITIEGLSYRLNQHCEHKIEAYNLVIDFNTALGEFMVFYPGVKGDIIPDSVPKEYRSPLNLKFKGKDRKVPEGARLYDMDMKDAIDKIETLIGLMDEFKDIEFKIEFVMIKVDRNKKEIPCEIYYEKGGEKIINKLVLK